jgi:hypothetical protein
MKYLRRLGLAWGRSVRYSNHYAGEFSRTAVACWIAENQIEASRFVTIEWQVRSSFELLSPNIEPSTKAKCLTGHVQEDSDCEPR